MKRRLESIVAGGTLALLFGFGALGTAAFGQETRLPTGLTLLGADDTGCDGELLLQSGIRGGGDGDVNRVRQGTYAVFEVQDPNVGWMCLGQESTPSDTMECPDGTTHVRISRNSDDDVVLFECYGEQR